MSHRFLNEEFKQLQRMAHGMGKIYMTFYRFPYFLYELRPVVLVSTFISGIMASYRLYHLDLAGVLKTKE